MDAVTVTVYLLGDPFVFVHQAATFFVGCVVAAGVMKLLDLFLP